MHRFKLSVAIILLTAPVCAQQAFPPAYSSVDGGHHSLQQFRYNAGRWQIMYGDLYGTLNVFSWKAMQFRRSSTKTDANVGRTYKNITMQLGKWNMNVTDNWAMNLGTTPTTVFSGNFTLPSTTGLPSKPAKWGLGAKAGDLQINFKSQFLFVSSEGLTVDITYDGGTLANSGAWTAGVNYIIDGVPTANMSTVATGTTVGSGSCPASGVFQNWLHADRMPPKKSSNLFRTQIYEYGPPAEANLFHFGVMTIDGLAIPQTFLASCNKLFLDLSKGYVLYPYMTDAQGDHFSDFMTVPYVPATVGKILWSQAACDMSGTLQLTRARSHVFPAIPTVNPYTATQFLYATNGGKGLGGSQFRLGWGPMSGSLGVVRFLN